MVVRPRGIDVSNWTLRTSIVSSLLLLVCAKRIASQEEAAEAEAIVRFEDRVTNLMHTGTNRARVIAWLMDAEGANGDFEYFCFTQGLPYGYFKEMEVA
jgi:hypothetical protein